MRGKKAKAIRRHIGFTKKGTPDVFEHELMLPTKRKQIAHKYKIAQYSQESIERKYKKFKRLKPSDVTSR